ncbi:hypothetical protein AB0903_31050 [Streptomyces sp. NPDC048389]
MTALFLIAMIGGFCGLSHVARRDLPLHVGTTTLILALAALGLALLH